jgi:DNA ligase-1
VSAGTDNLFASFANACEAVAATTKKNEKVQIVARYLLACAGDDAGRAAQFLTARPFPANDERTLQVGGSMLWSAISSSVPRGNEALNASFRKHRDLGSAAHDVLQEHSAAVSTLKLSDVGRAFDEIALARGVSPKAAVLTNLLSRVTALEAKYVIKIITSELRIGLKESLVEEAIAVAFAAPLNDVKRANMLTGDIGETLRLAASQSLAQARMKLFHPIGFMLATAAESAAEAFDEFAQAIVEDKYDGIRAQAHVDAASGKVRLYSRTLDEVSETFPELAPHLATVSDSVILDGEVLAWHNGRALAFSELQKRLGRKRVTEAMMRQVPVVYMAFDILAFNGELTLDLPLAERHRLLDSVFGRRQPIREVGVYIQPSLQFEPEVINADTRLLLAPSLRADSAEHLDELFDAAQQRGNEGLMVKSTASTYTPGRRGRSWLKLKRELATLDVVVTAVEFGNGKRAQVLSDYTFAVRDGDSLVNIGKAYNGLTDAEIAELTLWFQEHPLSSDGYVLKVEPRIVIEVAFNAVMRSARHDSGFALRFPRIARLRPDKPVEEIDTIERVQQIYSSQVHLRDRVA